MCYWFTTFMKCKNCICLRSSFSTTLIPARSRNCGQLFDMSLCENRIKEKHSQFGAHAVCLSLRRTCGVKVNRNLNFCSKIGQRAAIVPKKNFFSNSSLVKFFFISMISNFLTACMTNAKVIRVSLYASLSLSLTHRQTIQFKNKTRFLLL
jgi:hypothetical protein